VSRQQFETAVRGDQRQLPGNFPHAVRRRLRRDAPDRRRKRRRGHGGAGIKSSEAGIDLIVQPPGKRLQNVLLLSGGEKALTALRCCWRCSAISPALSVSWMKWMLRSTKPTSGASPSLVSKMSLTTQFIIITHSKKTMEAAPVLYGVTMPEPGVSRLVSVRFRENPGLQIVA